MSELFDEYVDQFNTSINTYGVALNFQKTSAKPTVPGSNPNIADVGTIRMSLEHFKLMAYLLKKQVDNTESQLGIDIPLPMQLMNMLKIAPVDWGKFWKRE